MHDNFDPRFWMQPVDDARPLAVWVVSFAGLLALRWIVPEDNARLGIVHGDLWFVVAGVGALAAAGLASAILALWDRWRS